MKNLKKRKGKRKHRPSYVKEWSEKLKAPVTVMRYFAKSKFFGSLVCKVGFSFI